MSCRRGCGDSASKIELIVKDLVRQMIEDGQLQEGLIDCADSRLWRNARVVTCDLLKDTVCQLADSGELCFVTPERVSINEKGKVCIMLSDGSTICSASSVPDTKVVKLKLDGTKIKIEMSDGSDVGSVDLTEVLPRVTSNDDGDIVISQKNKPDIVIEAVKVGATKSPDGTVVITNQNGSTVTVDPVREGDKGEQGDRGEDGKSAYQIWLEQGNQGSVNDFLAWLRNDENKVEYTDAFGDPVLNAF